MENEYCGLLINGRPLSDFGGKALLNFSIGETEVQNSIFQGVNRTSWHLLKSIFGRRSISINVLFTGETIHEAKIKRSIFNKECWGKCELYIVEDGFFYDCVCDSMGAETIEGIGETSASISTTYKFTGIRRGSLIKETIPTGGGEMLCQSTMPFTDAKLSTTVGATVASYSFAGATWANVTAGDQLVFDGITGKILQNGVNYANSVAWVDFPRLTPGTNVIPAVDAVTVEYYPTYL